MRTTRRALLAGALVLAGTAGCTASAPAPQPRGSLPGPNRLRGGRLLVAAHPDDDLFFMSPDLLADTRGAVTTVYVTDGDGGDGAAYAADRVAGVRSAYARMAGVADDWTASAHTVAGRVVDVHVLRAAPRLRLVFLRLPDGGVDGTGYAETGNESLLQLHGATGHVMHTIDGRRQEYTEQRLVDVLAGVMRAAAPETVRTLDYTLPLYSAEDHADHRAVALFARQAARTLAAVPAVVGYRGYPIADLPANVRGTELARKQAAYYAYAPHDRKVCGSPDACGAMPEGRWLGRQYRVG